jgi:hypothetical protein
MKSHVKENLVKQILTSNMRVLYEDDFGTAYEFSESVNKSIRDKAPLIKFNHWVRSKNGEWFVTAEYNGNKQTVFGKDINECLETAKRLLLNN